MALFARRVGNALGSISPFGASRKRKPAGDRDPAVDEYTTDSDLSYVEFFAERVAKEGMNLSYGDTQARWYTGAADQPPALAFPKDVGRNEGIPLPHRARLWCCRCCTLATMAETFDNRERGDWNCRFCETYMDAAHKHCGGCGLVQIVERLLAPRATAVFSVEALAVVSHPRFVAGKIGAHGPLFYAVECCQDGCATVFRCDLAKGVRVRDSQPPNAEGLLVDFTQWRCPGCARHACADCPKMVVATQILAGRAEPAEDGARARSPEAVDIPNLLAKTLLRGRVLE
ncbi:hypothetical protein DFH27DRAFT_360516 [Peziza echinospora]|nr:hypothetical protein DFH27DRAFT_360516 [Peziza echinospora]